MPRVKFSVEQTIHKLREAEVLVAQGQTIKDLCRQWSIAEPTYYRWRHEYGGLELDHAKRFKVLGTGEYPVEGAVAELTLDKLILKEASEGNF